MARAANGPRSSRFAQRQRSAESQPDRSEPTQRALRPRSHPPPQQPPQPSAGAAPHEGSGPSGQASGTDGIVSSAHLVSSHGPELSEFEYGLIVAHNAFARWVVRCMAAAGLAELTYTDALVLHHVNHRDRAKKLADICFVLNVEDTHVVNYALKKLLGLGLLESERAGKEVLYRCSARGRVHLARYREIRERCLISAVAGAGPEQAGIGALAGTLRALSGLYDQAARAASSL